LHPLGAAVLRVAGEVYAPGFRFVQRGRRRALEGTLLVDTVGRGEKGQASGGTRVADGTAVVHIGDADAGIQGSTSSEPRLANSIALCRNAHCIGVCRRRAYVIDSATVGDRADNVDT